MDYQDSEKLLGAPTFSQVDFQEISTLGDRVISVKYTKQVVHYQDLLSRGKASPQPSPTLGKRHVSLHRFFWSPCLI